MKCKDHFSKRDGVIKGSGFPLGFAATLGDVFFRYILALLQFREQIVVVFQNDQMTTKTSTTHAY